MMIDLDDVARWSTLDEGQFFERKSALDRSAGLVRRRAPGAIAREIAETLAAMANADGGELVVGIEDDGTPTGVPHTEDRVAMMRRAPGERTHVQPPLRYEVRDVRSANGDLLLHFRVDWSPEVHRLADGRYVLRVNDANMPFAAEQIAALKQTKAQGLIERSFPIGATLVDLDLDLVATLAPRMGVEGLPEDVLRRYRLIEGRDGRSIPCLAALLLFGKDPVRWHPRCGIDFVRWEGTHRKHGAELNVTKRVRIEEPLAVLIERAYETVRPHIRERQRLHDLFFTERLEYPTFVWQEAIVNAVAHRDYAIQGTPVEIWMFEDHFDVRSPGLPPHPASIDALNRRQHLHVSRNPLIVRVLADLGYMRELGEGVPRMFDEMEREGFYPPRFEDVGGVSLQVTLRNEPVYDRVTFEWLAQYNDFDLSGDQKRLLAFAHAHGDRFTSRDFQKLAGLDIYKASNSIKDLIRKGVARSTGKRSKVYEVRDPLTAIPNLPDEVEWLMPIFRSEGTIGNEDIRKALGISRKAATRLAGELCNAGWFERSGAKRGTRYRLVTPTRGRGRAQSRIS